MPWIDGQRRLDEPKILYEKYILSKFRLEIGHEKYLERVIVLRHILIKR